MHRESLQRAVRIFRLIRPSNHSLSPLLTMLKRQKLYNPRVNKVFTPHLLENVHNYFKNLNISVTKRDIQSENSKGIFSPCRLPVYLLKGLDRREYESLS